MSITVSYEKARGCGYRKPGGIYLVTGGMSAPCGLLPLELSVCPVCSAGFKPSRGWTWVDPSKLVEGKICPRCSNETDVEGHYCDWAMANRAGMIWVGEMYYKNADDFLREARDMGISRRIHSIPRGFKVGETWLLLAHRNAILVDADASKKSDAGKLQSYRSGIFYAFCPQRIEYILKGNESEEELERLEKRGLTLVQLKKLDHLGQEIVEA